MKLAVVGGGGMRTPLLIAGLLERRERVPVGQVVLYDVDPDALAMVRPASPPTRMLVMR